MKRVIEHARCGMAADGFGGQRLVIHVSCPEEACRLAALLEFLGVKIERQGDIAGTHTSPTTTT